MNDEAGAWKVKRSCPCCVMLYSSDIIIKLRWSRNREGPSRLRASESDVANTRGESRPRRIVRATRGFVLARWLARVKNHAGAPSRCHERGECIIDPISNRDRYIRRNSQAIGERLSGALWKLPGSVCLTRGHVIGCFGVWYWSDRAESMFTRAADLHGRCRDGYSCRRVVDEHSRYSDTRLERCSSGRSFRVEREMPNAFRRTKPMTKPVIVARD